MSRQIKKLLFSVFFVGALLSGCNNNAAMDATNTLPVPTLSTPSILLIDTPTITPLEPRWTSIATLSAEIKQQNLQQLFSANGNCEFPCWWGIRLGDPIQSIYSLAPLVGRFPSDYNGIKYSYPLSLDEFNNLDLSIQFSSTGDQVVKRIDIVLNYPYRFRDYYTAFDESLSIASVFSRYGRPNNILFYYQGPSEPDAGSTSVYSLVLVYKSAGFIIEYEGLFVDHDDPIQICSLNLTMGPAEYVGVEVSFVSLSLVDSEAIAVLENQYFQSAHRPLEEWTTMSQDDFYQEFLNPDNSSCIEVRNP